VPRQSRPQICVDTHQRFGDTWLVRVSLLVSINLLGLEDLSVNPSVEEWRLLAVAELDLMQAKNLGWDETGEPLPA